MNKDPADIVRDAFRKTCDTPTITEQISVPPVARNPVFEEWRIDLIAKIAHNVNRAYCTATGDDSQPDWDSAPDWQKDSARAGVKAHLASSMTPEESHLCWLAHKEAEGWKYGPVKDVEKKEHPCFMPYADLPAEQRVKDYLFKAVVESLK